ncbi:hypothetical protein PT148_09125, partial [Erysipelothrix rhusiopathiae]|nr:hypothetical protein [Erysipelothrix rhusiopathiae]
RASPSTAFFSGFSIVTSITPLVISANNLIPLNSVELVVALTVTMEEVQRVGYDAAVNKSDNQVLGLMQKNIRTDFFDFLATAP